MENANLDVGWIKFRTIASILESNSFKAFVLSKFDHDPWPAMVGRIPFIPILFARTKQVLKICFSSDKYMMLSCHFCGIMKVVSFKSTRNPLCSYHINLHLLLLLLLHWFNLYNNLRLLLIYWLLLLHLLHLNIILRLLLLLVWQRVTWNLWLVLSGLREAGYLLLLLTGIWIRLWNWKLFLLHRLLLLLSWLGITCSWLGFWLNWLLHLLFLNNNGNRLNFLLNWILLFLTWLGKPWRWSLLLNWLLDYDWLSFLMLARLRVSWIRLNWLLLNNRLNDDWLLLLILSRVRETRYLLLLLLAGLNHDLNGLLHDLAGLGLVKYDFTKTDFIGSMIVIKVKHHALRLSMKFWEVNCVPFLQGSPVKVSLSNHGPAASKRMENANLDMSWIKFRTIASILESNSTKM